MTKFRCIIDYDTWTLSTFINSQLIELPIQDNLNGETLIPPRCEVYRQIEIQNPQQDYVILSKEIQPGVFCANSIINADNSLIRQFITQQIILFKFGKT